jgi:RNase P subunit RPR2
MNPVQKRLSCRNHKPTFEKQDGGSVTYFCGQCGWRGRFGVSSAAKAGR